MRLRAGHALRRYAEKLMAIQFNGQRNVAQQPKSVPQHVADHLATTAMNVTRAEFDALKAEVEYLRELIARQAVAPAKTSRAEYYREYRKRLKTDGQQK
jgi:hypothetical protein